MKPKVFITRRIPDAGLQRILAVCDVDLWDDLLPPPYDILIQRSQGVEGVLTLLTDHIDANFMDSVGKSLKVISQYAVGYDNIDIAAAQARGIPVGHTPGVLTEATADLAFTLMMAAARRIQEGVEYIRAGQWKTWHPTILLGSDVTGATLGILGFGRIGQALAKRASGFDMRVLAHDPYISSETAAQLNATLVDLDTLLAESDFVSVHTLLNAQTRHLINRDTLAKMKPSAILINTSRGPVVDQKALYEALKSGVICAAALDVTDPEPLPLDDPLYSLPNALIVPHIASATIRTRDNMAIIAAENLIAGVTGKPLPHAVPGK